MDAVRLETHDNFIECLRQLVERFPRLESGACKSTTPCTVIYEISAPIVASETTYTLTSRRRRTSATK